MAKSTQLSFRDRLSSLTRSQALALLGPDGEPLMRQGSCRFEIEADRDAYLGGDLLRVRMNDLGVPGGKAIVVVTLMSGKVRRLHIRCDRCEKTCEHCGAAIDFLLDERLALGLAETPDASVPFELLSEQELRARALAERQEKAATEKMSVRSQEPTKPWTDYLLTSHGSGKTYRVALRGRETESSYCSCPDFRTNRLGVCKHILHTLAKVEKRFPAAKLNRPYQRQGLSLRLDYGDPCGLRFNLPHRGDAAIARLAEPYSQATLSDAAEAMRRLRLLAKHGHEVHVYPDAEEWMDRQLTQEKLREAAAEVLRDPAGHAFRRELLRAELLPYQMQGAAFAVGAGRAVLADDMGLGKTIQGIAAAELWRRWAGIRRVLIVCPASLKSQWRNEIHRFCDHGVQLIMGGYSDRREQYASDSFFTVCNYEQVLRDLETIEGAGWDLIILDEGQRIKNWQSKTSQVIRSLKSRYALVLSGTPLENRLDDLYTVVNFVDDRRLGPAHQFFHRHRQVEESGRVTGYQRLDELREQLRPILLRRTRAQVMSDLPERTTEIVRIAPTQEQLEAHQGFMSAVLKIINKPYLTEMDLLRLQQALLKCRLSANGTMLVDGIMPGYSSKLDRLTELLEELAPLQDRKIIVFSEWRKMLDLIEPILQRLEVPFVRLDGNIPQKARPAIVKEFQDNDQCRVILLTNAGGTGLNLQAANTVINVDLPWNPAVLEQRVARAHRMGQLQPVHVYVLITEETLEERLLDTLANKHDLALAALDADSDVATVEFHSGIEALRRKLERMLGQKPDAPRDVSQQRAVERETAELAERRERVASAGGALIGAALELVGTLIADGRSAEPAEESVQQLQASLETMVERNEEGLPQLRITLANDEALRNLARTLAHLLVK